ncbi:MAG: hypothetical protein QNL33_18440 [Akkermansiaceae bacterium]|jgi:hypothetical protein
MLNRALSDLSPAPFFSSRLGNPDANPTSDPDGDGQNNTFEFIAGVVPTDRLSFFSFSVQPFSGDPEQTQIVFDPIVADRSYTVMISSDLSSGSWNPFNSGTTSNDGDQRTVIDPTSRETQIFYRIRITRP